MNWIQLKKSVQELLSQRKLSNPQIRLNALDNLEEIICNHFNEIYNNPSALLNYEINDFKEKISTFKDNKKLNDAEKSIINNFYQILKASENDKKQKGNLMTIQEAIIKTLVDANNSMSSTDILNHINKNNYYTFGANDSIQAVRPELTKLFKEQKVTRVKDGRAYFYTLKV
jgi:hypothetical protein